MSEMIYARALETVSEYDALATLHAIDHAYANAMNLTPQLSRSSLSFYSRSGHSFVAMKQQAIQGFVLAQSIWNGTSPTVFVNYLALAQEDDIASRQALLEAVTKSAYDSAVYRLEVMIPELDLASHEALISKSYSLSHRRSYTRQLGSQGNAQHTTESSKEPTIH